MPGPVSAVNTTAIERGAYVVPDGRALYFSRYRAADASDETIYRATIGPAGIGELTEVAWPGVVAGHGLPLVTPDERTIYFAVNGGPVVNIWTATRMSSADPFGTPTPVAELNQPGANGADLGWISGDGCVLYFSTSVSGSGEDLYFAQRGK
jgi:hypothetical protein